MWVAADSITQDPTVAIDYNILNFVFSSFAHAPQWKCMHTCVYVRACVCLCDRINAENSLLSDLNCVKSILSLGTDEMARRFNKVYFYSL